MGSSAEFLDAKIRQHLSVGNVLFYIDTPQRIQRLALQVNAMFGPEALRRIHFYEMASQRIEKLAEGMVFTDLVSAEFAQIDKMLTAQEKVVSMYASARLKPYGKTGIHVAGLIKRWLVAVLTAGAHREIMTEIKGEIAVATFQHRTYRRIEKIAERLALKGYSIMTGGGPGGMEAANKGARRAIRKGAQVKSIGLNIDLPFEPQSNEGVTVPIGKRLS
jgi:hypothetical protein